MFDTTLNEKLARTLAQAAPPGWQRIIVDAEVGDDYIDMGLKASANGTLSSFTLPSREQAIVEDTIWAMRKDLTKEASSPWSRCNITITADGDFRMDVSYDS